MNTASPLAILLLCGRAAACDITGWPSTAHHPNPVQLLPGAEIVATYRLSRPLAEEYVQVVRKAVRTATGDAGATLEQVDRGRTLAVHLTRPPDDWKVLDEAAMTAAPAVTRQDITVSVRLHPDSIDEAFRMVAGTAAAILGTGGSCRLDLRGGLVVVTFPTTQPPTSAMVWKLRKAAANAHATGAGTS
jgi:hypothetical protein